MHPSDRRVQSGKQSQQWFNNFRPHDAGVYQIVDTPPGAVCEAGAYVQSWSNAVGSTNTLSDLKTQDDRDNYRWFIRVDTSGGIDAYADSVLISRAFGYNDGIYDKFVLIKYRFVAQGDKTTVFFGSRTLWPMGNNNSYIDDAYVICAGARTATATPASTPTAIVPQATPTQSGPAATPTQIVPAPTPNPQTNCKTYPCRMGADMLYTVGDGGLNVRSTLDYASKANITRSYSAREELRVRCRIDTEDGAQWGSLEACESIKEYFVLTLPTGRKLAFPEPGMEGR